ncbi:MAG TPA: TIGR04282 family arsenosugar biosynthesis glycosyltransferase [Chthoniobacterales bacterium]|nr:TIGR04282 family arsenosugar biosynthesis glycosyltransferase [Chthoniobacterales bacterium]
MKLEILTSGHRNAPVTDKCAMGVMIKTPRNGFSKTRLSPPFSLEEAANISRCFLKDTSSTIEALSLEDPFVVGVAIYTPIGSEDELGKLLPPGFKMIAQREADFATRLLGATQDLFSAGFAAVCLVNSDSPTIPFHYLQELATFLKEPTDRMVIGPSLDGGYYALGLRRAHPRLFEDITWNTDRVYGETIERSKEISLPAMTLPAWYDVDDQLWLNRLLSELFPERANETVPQGSPALYTKEFLRQILAREGSGRIWPGTSASAGPV